MLSCSVSSCTNNSVNSDLSILYYPFPQNVLSEEWVRACGWHENPIDVGTARICSTHFEQNAYDTELTVVDNNVCCIKTLKYDAVPTLYLPQTHIIIKEDNMEGVVVYTITQGDSSDVTIELQNDIDDKDLSQVQTSTSNTKSQEALHQKNTDGDKEKYEHIKNYLDLYLLKTSNKDLKRKIEKVEEEIAKLEVVFHEKETTYGHIEEECNRIQTKISSTKVNNATVTQQDQRMILSKVFSESQIKILFGKKRVSWTNDDMAVGYTIRHLSNKRCYNYLTKNLNIPLPGISSIKRWITTKKIKKSELKEKAEDNLIVIE